MLAVFLASVSLIVILFSAILASPGGENKNLLYC
jgi:hypothetical protein